jgi:UTP:GlnB (protein PII) uridylyltransferase
MVMQIDGSSASGGLSVADLQRFVDSMPFDYRRRHDDDEVRRHAEIVRRRGNAFVHVERTVAHMPSTDWLCFVTDDRPGLLSQLSAVVLAHSLAVVTAHVYCRRRADAPKEAVDFFLVRSLGSERCNDAMVAAIRRQAEAVLRGETPVENLARHAADTARPTEPPSTNAYFSKSNRDRLVVESRDRAGLLLALTLTLYREGVSILHSEVTTFAGVARDEFLLAEPNGEPLSDERRRSVVCAVLDALDMD